MSLERIKIMLRFILLIVVSLPILFLSYAVGMLTVLACFITGSKEEAIYVFWQLTNEINSCFETIKRKFNEIFLGRD